MGHVMMCAAARQNWVTGGWRDGEREKEGMISCFCLYAAAFVTCLLPPGPPPPPPPPPSESRLQNEDETAGESRRSENDSVES